MPKAGLRRKPEKKWPSRCEMERQHLLLSHTHTQKTKMHNKKKKKNTNGQNLSPSKKKNRFFHRCHFFYFGRSKKSPKMKRFCTSSSLYHEEEFLDLSVLSGTIYGSFKKQYVMEYFRYHFLVIFFNQI